MRICERCGAEYQDAVASCADCGESVWVPPTAKLDEPPARPASHTLDERKFVRAAVADDPLTSEQFQRVLEAAGVPVFVRPHRADVDGFTGGAWSYWELLVPEHLVQRAVDLLGLERTEIEAFAEENARAAELEEAETHRDEP